MACGVQAFERPEVCLSVVLVDEPHRKRHQGATNTSASQCVVNDEPAQMGDFGLDVPVDRQGCERVAILDVQPYGFASHRQ